MYSHSDCEKLNTFSSRYSDPGVFHAFPHLTSVETQGTRSYSQGPVLQNRHTNQKISWSVLLEPNFTIVFRPVPWNEFFCSHGFMGKVVNRLEMCVWNQTHEEHQK